MHRKQIIYKEERIRLTAKSVYRLCMASIKMDL